MRFLVDAQLPSALARMLVASGHEAEHVLDLGMGRSKDRTIRDHALAVNAVIVTKDEDFIALHLQARSGPQIVWIRWGNVRRQALLDGFAKLLPGIVQALAAGEPIVELA